MPIIRFSFRKKCFVMRKICYVSPAPGQLSLLWMGPISQPLNIFVIWFSAPHLSVSVIEQSTLSK